MPIVFVPSTRPGRILRAVSLLFLCNVIVGGGVGLWLEASLHVLQNSPLVGMGAGVLLAELGAFLIVRALYLRGLRAAGRRPFPLDEFLDEMLMNLLGAFFVIPIGISLLVTSYGKGAGGIPWESGDSLLLGFGAVALALGVRSALRLAAFMRRTGRVGKPASPRHARAHRL